MEGGTLSTPLLAWGWMEWKEGNISTAREYYQKALSIDPTSESAARCLQAWGVLEQRAGNLSAARRLFRSSLNVNSQSYVTWMTWATMEEDQGNSMRADEIRDLYFQQTTTAHSSWIPLPRSSSRSFCPSPCSVIFPPPPMFTIAIRMLNMMLRCLELIYHPTQLRGANQLPLASPRRQKKQSPEGNC